MRSKLAAAGLALLVAVGAAFVLLGSTDSQVTDPIAQAATLSAGSPGYRMNLRMRISTPNLSTPILASANAIVDLRDQAVSMKFGFDLPSSVLRMDMLLIGGNAYIKLPELVTNKAPALGGKPWLGVNFTKVAGGAGVPGLSSLGGSQTLTDPTDMLQYLRAASNGVTNEGQERVDGLLTTHYHVTLSLDRLGANLPAAERALVQRVLSQLQQTTATHTFPVDVWIDHHGLVRRMVMLMSLHLAAGAVLQEAMTADFSDYGPQPRPTPPPADQVTDLSSLVHVSG